MSQKYPEIENPNITEEAKQAAYRFRDQFAPQLEEFGKDLDAYIKENPDGLRDQDISIVMDSIFNYVMPHWETIVSVGGTALNTTLKFVPTTLVVNTCTGIFRKLLEQDPEVARRALNEFAAPIDNAPISDALKDIHAAILEGLQKVFEEFMKSRSS